MQHFNSNTLFLSFLFLLENQIVSFKAAVLGTFSLYKLKACIHHREAVNRIYTDLVLNKMKFCIVEIITVRIVTKKNHFL